MEDIKIRNREVFETILGLARSYSERLGEKIDDRVKEMESDNNAHYLIYRVLGIMTEEGNMIDVYQNKGRFLYKYAGTFLEQATIICMQSKFEKAQEKVKISNTQGQKPKTFEIDCLIDKRAHEIKWRDSTTDGDHITKEHTRVKAIVDHGHVPIRVMFYYPNREQAIKKQATLATLYKGVGGEYYGGDDAWKYIERITDIDLLRILEEIAIIRGNDIC